MQIFGLDAARRSPAISKELNAPPLAPAGRRNIAAEQEDVLDSATIQLLAQIATDAATAGAAASAARLMQCLQKLRPACVHVSVARAMVLAMVAQPQEALAILDQATPDTPSTAARIAAAKGLILQLLGRQAEAEAVLRPLSKDGGEAGALAQQCLTESAWWDHPAVHR